MYDKLINNHNPILVKRMQIRFCIPTIGIRAKVYDYGSIKRFMFDYNVHCKIVCKQGMFFVAQIRFSHKDAIFIAFLNVWIRFVFPMRKSVVRFQFRCKIRMQNDVKFLFLSN